MLFLNIIKLLLGLFIMNEVKAQNFYDSDPHISELTPKSFDKAIHNTNYTSLVEFYARGAAIVRSSLVRSARQQKDWMV